MSDDVKHSAIWATALTVVLSSMIWGMAWYQVTAFRTPMEKGYSQRLVPGQYITVWEKDAVSKGEP